MLFGKVVGSVVCSRKTENIVGLKLLLVANISEQGNPADGYAVAADAVQAGVGDVVIYSTGSAARQTDTTQERPVDAIIMGIVDMWDIEGENVYTKVEPLEVADV